MAQAVCHHHQYAVGEETNAPLISANLFSHHRLRYNPNLKRETMRIVFLREPEVRSNHGAHVRNRVNLECITEPTDSAESGSKRTCGRVAITHRSIDIGDSGAPIDGHQA